MTGLRGRGALALAGGVVVLVLIAVAVVAWRSGGGSATGEGEGAKGDPTAPPAAAGRDIPLLDGRLVVVAPPGWELRDQTADTATMQLALRDPTGRDLLSTLVLTAIPGGGSLEATLTLDGGTRFEVQTGAGPLQAAAVPGASARVVAATTRPPSTFFFSLSIYALDGQVIEVPLLQRLFAEQVVPQLRFT